VIADFERFPNNCFKICFQFFGIKIDSTASLALDSEELLSMKRTFLSLVALVALGLPAQAQNYLDLPSWQHWNLNTISSDEQARIQRGIKNGSLTPAESAKLQSRLDSINAYKAKLSAGGLNASERVRIDSELDKLAEAIYRESNDNDRRSSWLGKRPFDWAKGWKANLPNDQNWNAWQHWNFNTMTTDEQARINAGVRNGSITKSEAATLQARLNRINTMKAQLADNGLNMSERRRIDAELDALGQSIYRESHDANVANKWTGNKPWAWTKTWKHDRRDGVPGAGLTTQEAHNINREAHNIENQRDRMEASGGRLTRQEEHKLERREAQLEKKTKHDRRD
jgi:hypothetical protein